MVQSLYKRMDSWTQGGAPYWTFCREAQRGETGRNREERKSVREKQCKNMTNGYIKSVKQRRQTKSRKCLNSVSQRLVDTIQLLRAVQERSDAKQKLETLVGRNRQDKWFIQGNCIRCRILYTSVQTHAQGRRSSITLHSITTCST